MAFVPVKLHHVESNRLPALDLQFAHLAVALITGTSMNFLIHWSFTVGFLEKSFGRADKTNSSI